MQCLAASRDSVKVTGERLKKFDGWMDAQCVVLGSRGGITQEDSCGPLGGRKRGRLESNEKFRESGRDRSATSPSQLLMDRPGWSLSIALGFLSDGLVSASLRDFLCASTFQINYPPGPKLPEQESLSF